MWVKTQFGELLNLNKATEIKINYYKPVAKFAIEAFGDKKKKSRLEILGMFDDLTEAQEYLDKLAEKLGAEEI